MTKSALRMMATAAAAALVVGTLSTATAGAAPPAVATERANFQVPKVGQCHRLTLRQVSQENAARRPVPCSERHTLVTVAVKRLSGKVDWTDPYLFLDKASTPCYNVVERVLGRNDKTRWSTAYEMAWYFPTKRERARGAKWIRCDLILLGGNKVMPLPEDLALPSGPMPDRFARCLTGEKAAATVCSRPHGWRSAGAGRLSGGPYPEPAEARAAALRVCPRITSTRYFRYTIPWYFAWRAGSRALVCYDQTHR